MRNKFFGIFSVVVVMAAAGYGVLKNANQNELNDVALANIEALAAGEDSGNTGGGSGDCSTAHNGKICYIVIYGGTTFYLYDRW